VKGEQPPHLLIGRLGEVLIPETNRLKIVRSAKAATGDERIESIEFAARLTRGNRDGDDDPFGMTGENLPDRGVHGRPGGETIIDNDDWPVGNGRGSPGATIQFFTPRQFRRLPGDDRLNLGARQTQRPDNPLIEKSDAARRERAKGQLLLAGNAELAHKAEVERGPELPGDLESDRHSAARQGEDQQIRLASELAERCRQLATGIFSVRELIHGSIVR